MHPELHRIRTSARNTESWRSTPPGSTFYTHKFQQAVIPRRRAATHFLHLLRMGTRSLLRLRKQRRTTGTRYLVTCMGTYHINGASEIINWTNLTLDFWLIFTLVPSWRLPSSDLRSVLSISIIEPMKTKKMMSHTGCCTAALRTNLNHSGRSSSYRRDRVGMNRHRRYRALNAACVWVRAISSLNSSQISRSAPGAQYRLACRISSTSPLSLDLSVLPDASGKPRGAHSSNVANMQRQGNTSFPTKASWPCFLPMSAVRECMTFLPQCQGNGRPVVGKARSYSACAINSRLPSSKFLLLLMSVKYVQVIANVTL